VSAENAVEDMLDRKSEAAEDFIWESYGGWFDNSAYVGMNNFSEEPSHLLRCKGEETQYFSRAEFQHLLSRMMTYWKTHLEYARQTDLMVMTDTDERMVFKGHAAGDVIEYPWAEFKLITKDDDPVWCDLTMFPRYEPVLQSMLEDASYEQALKSVKKKINARKKFVEDDPFGKI
jgi:hypothetical protein